MSNLARLMRKEPAAEGKTPQSKSTYVSAYIGETLVEQGLISSDQLAIALHEQKQQGKRLGETLVKLGFIDAEGFAFALARLYDIDAIDLTTHGPDPRLANLLPQEVALRCMALPIKRTGDLLTVAMADPLDLAAKDEVLRHFPKGTRLKAHVAKRQELSDIIGACGRETEGIDALFRSLETSTPTAQQHQQSGSGEHPVIRLVNLILCEAIDAKASDIHLEPEESFVRMRYRLDGALHQVRAVHRAHWPALSQRIKIMAGMNIADTRGIQDGRFNIEHEGKNVDCRVAIMPSVGGETIVIRLLDHSTSLLPLGELGYNSGNLDKIRRLSLKPHGITLLTGPTGSGKTTTLYSLLQELNAPDVHIATLEEPVEYQLSMIRQTSIQEAQNLDFAAGVRGLLRMDPDIILIGEIRDPDTAQMALRAAMTGHQVYSTLHCNDVFGALPRLLDLGLQARTLAGNLSGIVAQRLVRTLCPHCKRYYRASEQEAMLLNADPKSAPMLATAQGCDACSHTGRKGRTVIAEVLQITEEIDDLITRQAPRAAIIQAACHSGFKPMRDDGIDRVLRGEMAFADLRRTVDLTIPQSSTGMSNA